MQYNSYNNYSIYDNNNNNNEQYIINNDNNANNDSDIIMMMITLPGASLHAGRRAGAPRGARGRPPI